MANKMTAAEARSFDTFSATNAAIVDSALECGCEPYEDVFTFNRWKAQGFHVKRGEHGIKLPVIKRVERKDEETGEVERFGIRGRAAVFCRHQVEANN